MTKLKSIFHPEWFKLITILVSLLACIPTFGYAITPFLKLFHIYTAAVLIFDFFGERRLFRNKGRWILAAFILLYAVTLLTNLNLLSFSGISDFCYLLAALAVVYSYGESDKNKTELTSAAVCTFISVLNAVGIWMFFTKFFYYEKHEGIFIGMYIHENRLCGMWGNPAVLGMTSLIGLCFALLLIFGLKNRKWRVVFAVMAAVNFITILLSNARAAIYAFVLMSAVYVFLRFIKDMKGFKTFIKSFVAATLAAVIAFVGCKMLQRAISYVDFRYDYYLKNIDEDYLRNPDKEDDEDKDKGGNKHSIGRFDTGLNGRGELWKNGLVLILDRPLFGHGLNNIDQALERNDIDPMEISGNLHNVYLDTIAAFGVAGFICLALYLFIMLGNVKKYFKYYNGEKRNETAITAAAVAGFLLYGMADSSMMFSMYPTALAFWYILARLAHLTEEGNIQTGNHRTEPIQLLEEKFLQKRSRDVKSICFINDSLGGGGAEQILLNVSSAMAQNGYDVTVFTLWGGGELEAKLDSRIHLKTADPFDMPVLKRALYWLNRHFLPKRLYNFLFLDRRYDYTVAFLEGLSTRVAADTKILQGDKKYAWVHIDFKHQNWTLPYYRTIDKQKAGYKPFDRIFCVSEAVKESFIEVIGYPEKVAVQHNLVDTRKVAECINEPCPQERPEGLLLCSVGRLNPQKGYDRLINVAERLEKEGFNFTLWILGEGAERQALEGMIAKAGLTENVRLLGFKKNPFCYAALADVFVCSSRAEGYSTVITENLIMGKPIVSTLCAGVREQLGEDEYGIVTENNEDALFEGLKKMLSNASLREHYAKMAQERSKTMAYDVLLKQYLEIFS